MWILLLFLGCVLASEPSQRVLYSSVNQLTFHQGVKSSGRRSSPQLQLQCHGYHCHQGPAVVHCTKSYLLWKCTADLPTNLAFRQSDVNCEGYDYPDDPYILDGSCVLRYSLETPEDRQHDLDRSKTELLDTLFGMLLFSPCLLCMWCCNCFDRNKGYNNGSSGHYTATTYASHSRR